MHRPWRVPTCRGASIAPPALHTQNGVPVRPDRRFRGRSRRADLRIGYAINETGLGGARDKTGRAFGLIWSAISTRCAVPHQSGLVPLACGLRLVPAKFRGTIRGVSRQSRQSATCLSKFRFADNGLATNARLCLYLAIRPQPEKRPYECADQTIVPIALSINVHCEPSQANIRCGDKCGDTKIIVQNNPIKTIV